MDDKKIRFNQTVHHHLTQKLDGSKLVPHLELSDHSTPDECNNKPEWSKKNQTHYIPKGWKPGKDNLSEEKKEAKRFELPDKGHGFSIEKSTVSNFSNINDSSEERLSFDRVSIDSDLVTSRHSMILGGSEIEKIMIKGKYFFYIF